MLVFARQVLRRVPQAGLPAPTVVWGSSPHLFQATAAWRLSRRHRAPYVLEVRDLWPESLVELGGYPRLHPAVLALGLLERFLYRRARRIFTLLPFSIDYIEGRGAARGSVQWLPNGIDMDAWPAPPPEPERSTVDIYYCGTIGHANGLDALLDAAKLLAARGRADIQVHLVGEGAELPRLRQRVEAEAIRNVRLAGSVPRTQVAKVLEDASACVITLLGRGLFEYGVSPNKLYDYMAAARPIIFSVSATRNQVVEAQCGLAVPPDQPAALADAMEKLAALPLADRRAMGQRGRHFAEQHHSYRAIATRLAHALDQVCGLAPGPT